MSRLIRKRQLRAVCPAIEYLKLKSFIAETKVSDDELTTAALHKKTVAAFEALHPFLNFINRTIEA